MRAGSEVDTSSTITKVFRSGSWTVETDGRRTGGGCFDAYELKSIRRAVQRAPWNVTASPIACFAYDPNFTEYRVHGAVRFTERKCSGKTADDATMRAIELVKQEIAEEHAAAPTPPSPTSPPPKPPAAACKASGTPLFEIAKRSDAAQPTSRISLYPTGTWTFQPIDEHGIAGPLSSGCLDKSTLASLRQVITESPWDTTTSQITCRAYSPSFTEYFVHGKLEYTARLCGAQRLDEKSLGAIKIIESELAQKMSSHLLGTRLGASG